MRKHPLLLLGIGLTISLTAHAGAKTIYVAPTGNDGGAGTAADPYATIQHAIDVAEEGDTIDVAVGVYRENLVWDTKSLILQGAGDVGEDGEPNTGDEKEGDGHPDTVVDGDVNEDGRGDDRCLVLSQVPAPARVEGFTFQNGKAPANGSGGGLYLYLSAVTLNDNTIRDNVTTWSGGPPPGPASAPPSGNIAPGPSTTGNGGGLFLENCEAAHLINNTIIGNSATGSGGGLFLKNCEATLLINNTITGNSAPEGGGLTLYLSPATLNGNTITSNSATGNGGGLFLWGNSPTLVNNTITGNAATDGGGVYLGRGSPTLTNNTISDNTGEGLFQDPTNPGKPVITNGILWGQGEEGDLVNASATYSCVGSGETAGEGNISEEPAFVGGGDYHLQPTSPCINRGNNEAPNLPDTDGDGDPRIWDGTVDMGADEVVPSGEPQPDLWIKAKFWKGKDRYNNDGNRQTVKKTGSAGEPVEFRAKVQNDGPETDIIWVRGPRSNQNWTVQYLNQKGKDVTALVTRKKGWKRKLGPGRKQNFLIRVTPASGLDPGKKRKILVTATSGKDPTKVDAIKAVTRVKED